MFAPNLLAQADPEVWNAVHLEHRRQDDHVELIASENYVSPAVLIAHGTQLTNKYAEGYPGNRYYGGCEYVDMVETIALERAKKPFGASWANVQPHSGSQPNQAVYAAALRPGDTLLGMSLAHGGHLTHGSPVNYSGKLYKVISYGLNENEEIDYAQAERLAMQHRPRLIVTGASAYAPAIDWKRFRAIAAKAVALGEALKPEFKSYQGRVLENARTMLKVFTERGVRVVSGRTDCHMFLLDLRRLGITGRDAESALGRAHITLNKNAIPNDPQKPMVTSGVRVGTPAMTTRGFRKPEAEKLAHLICDVLERPADETRLERVAEEVRALCARFPVYA